MSVMIWSVLAVPLQNTNAKTAPRFLVHTFKYGQAVVSVGIFEALSGPKIQILTVQWELRRQAKNSAKISEAEFNRLWSTFISNVGEEYTFNSTSRKQFDVDFYYVFLTAEKRYAVPRWKASPGLLSLVMQMRSYAKKL